MTNDLYRVEPNDDAVRWTTVHSRYHVSGRIGDDWELIEALPDRLSAFKLARHSIGPRDYEETTVFDSMARHGKPQTWRVLPDGTAHTLEIRP